MGTYGDPWGPTRANGDLWGGLTPTPPPLPPSIKSVSDISHILLDTLQKQHAIPHIRHQTLYTILGDQHRGLVPFNMSTTYHRSVDYLVSNDRKT